MLWIVLVLLLNILRLINADIFINGSTCGSTYDADYFKSVAVLYDNTFSIEFTKDWYKQYLCVSGKEIALSCDTKLEYHAYFVKNRITPEVCDYCNRIQL